jgi:methylated-DNA-[protein]-cysteine S-methyltransferase
MIRMGLVVLEVRGWGWIGVGTTRKGVARIVLPHPSRQKVVEELKGFDDDIEQLLAERCAMLLSRYLRGEPVSLDDIPIDWQIIPPTYRRILQTLQRTVPAGRTIAYSELARRCGMPKAMRLVGQAMARNPVPLLVPCHRVVRLDGSLGGFSGGIHLKRRLLELEKRRSLSL